MKKILSLLSGLFILSTAIAQEKGFVRGNIADGDFGGPMIGATITVAELPGVGTTTDFDGNYSLPLEPGTYTIEISFISYAKQSFPNTAVTAGEVNIIDAVMTSAIEELATVEIVAEVRRNSETAMLMDMKNATSVTDGLSSQTFRKMGDSDLSGAIKRVTGVTVQNGKYVYVRGLGDRYTKTTLNGMSLPGLDPDVNAVQIDIFPTRVLENVAVSKTFAPDLDGDFTGGLVNVVTKSFPEEKTTQIGAGLTFIPGMHFNPDFILYDRNPLDWTGFDMGSRELPIDPELYVPNPVLNDPAQEDITRSFNSTLATSKKTAYPNGSFNFNHGNQINREAGGTFGYNAVFNYSNETVFYQDFESNDYLKDNFDFSNNELVRQVTRKGDVGKNNVMWTGLVSGAYKTSNSTFNAMVMRSQAGETSASYRVNRDVEQTGATLYEDVLTYTQRELTTGIVSGEHRISVLEISWANAFSVSRVYDPDFRETRVSIIDGEPTLLAGDGAGIFRFWRDLNEQNESFRADIKLPIAEKAFLKFGGAGTLKWREFNTYSYKHTRRDLIGTQGGISEDPNWFLDDENIWTADPENFNNEYGTYTIGTFQEANQYEARQNIFSGYLMANHQFLKVLKLVYGARVEHTTMYYTGEDNDGIVKYNDTEVLNNLNILPSLNVVYKITDDMNLRGGANRTLARPSFKEKSIAQIYDPITKRTFNGNIDLEQTDINNYDLRYEYFLSARELLAIGGFYKTFNGHIEMVSFEEAPDNLKPRNSGTAESFGLEVELRKGLPNVESSFLSNLFLSTNFSIVESRVDMNQVEVNNFGKTEKQLRTEWLRDGESVGNYRPMAGQSPYAVNVALSYEDAERRNSVSLAYNVQGEQLTIIASGRVPDVYTIPFHSLNFNAYRNFGEQQRSRVTLGVNNILDEDRTLVYRSHGAEDQIYTTYKPGIGISLKYSLTF